jgi:hypothetical protein
VSYEGKSVKYGYAADLLGWRIRSPARRR